MRLNTISNSDVLILCGGEGKRLRSVVRDKPKAMADINGRPFLEILIDKLIMQGFRRFILSVGYQKKDIIDHFKNHNKKNLEIIFSEETILLGTGGAVKNALPLVKTDEFFVINGDSLFPNEFKFNEFYKNHKDTNALLSIVLTEVVDAADYGRVKIDSESRIIDFSEKKTVQSSTLVNAGVYLMNRKVQDFMPNQQAFSLECDFFPKLLGQNCRGFLSPGHFLDIGVPERYEALKNVLKEA